MKDKDTISKGPKRRDPTCLQLLHDIAIPAGTILRHGEGKPGPFSTFSCPVAGGRFVITDENVNTGNFKRVVA